jgi:hypothetical protein
MKKEIKVGSKIKMFFRCIGLVSDSNVTIIAMDENTVTISDTWHSDISGEEENGRFDRKTGRCLNDNTAMGTRRDIMPII